MNRLVKIGATTLLSGGLISHGSLGAYIGDATRRAMGYGFAHFKDGAVHYLGKDVNLLKRGLIQTAYQMAYGLLRSYPRYIKYWERTVRDKNVTTASETSIMNKNGQYYRLIQDQKAVAEVKSYKDTIVGNIVADYMELSIPEAGQYYDMKLGKITPNKDYGCVTFVDLQPEVQVSSKNNIVMTTVQGRDYTRKELVSGGDLEISISGKITSKYPDLYPDAEVAKFLKLMFYRGVIECDNTILRQFNITRLIVTNYSFSVPEFRNIQPYTLSCVAVEPSESIQLKNIEEEKIDEALRHSNKWIKWVKLGADVIDPSSLLKISKLWI